MTKNNEVNKMAAVKIDYKVEVYEFTVRTDKDLPSEEVKDYMESGGYETVRSYSSESYDSAKQIFEKGKTVVVTEKVSDNEYEARACKLIKRETDSEGTEYWQTLEFCYPDIKVQIK